ncbi:DNA-binding transcriptional activator GcvA [Proteus mirabilis]|uniref:DNA-binding transcriptional activator GcvA n=1 Tax=Proteus mirabilis TaxID=584 RepID=A0A2X2DR84_PROMI|nr:DNA-binding transcriptional activator GcvA [Proteus mirabilis]
MFVNWRSKNQINVQQGPIFSHSSMVIQAAVHGQGVALVNNVMARSEIESGRLVRPFQDVLVSKNAFYLVCQDSQAELGKNCCFPSMDFISSGK